MGAVLSHTAHKFTETNMKLLFDFFPIILFFAAYKFFGIFTATLVAMAAALAQTSLYWFKHRRLEILHVSSLVIIGVLGSATILLHDELFIKWKPTVINLFFALAFFFSKICGKTPLIKRLLSSNIELPDFMWTRLNWAWCAFFFFLAAINLYVVYNFSTDVWVNFKLFGMLGLTIVFIIVQTVYLLPYAQKDHRE